MHDNIVLLLMQVKGMSRKTVYKSFQLESKEYSIMDIQDIIKQAEFKTRKLEFLAFKN